MPSRYSISSTEASRRFDAFSARLRDHVVDRHRQRRAADEQRARADAAKADGQIRIALHDIDLVHGDTERFRHHLGIGGLQPLPHRHGAGMQDDATLGGSVQADLFGMRAPAGPFDVAGEAAAVEQALFLRGLLAPVEPVPIGKFRGALQHVRERAGVIDLTDGVGVGQLRRLDVVHLADGARIHADLTCGGVHQPLDNEYAFGTARTAIGADGRGVGHDRFDLVMHQRQIVDAALHERPEHQRDDVACAGGIGAGAADRAHPIGQHAALGVEREFAR